MDQDQQALHGQSLDESTANLTRAEQRYQDAVRAYSDAGGINNADLVKRGELQSELDKASTAVATANRDRANLMERIANDSRQRASTATDPARQRMWNSQADNAEAQADWHRAQTSLLDAKNQDDLQKAQAAVTNANSRLQRVASQNQSDDSRAELNKARAAVLPAVSQSQIAANTARGEYYGAGATERISRANLTDVKATNLQQPTVVSGTAGTSDPYIITRDPTTGKLSAEPNRNYQPPLLGSATSADPYIMMRGADGTLTKQDNPNYRPQTVGTVGPTDPQITTYDARTGQFSSQQNPGYINTQSQSIKDTYGAIDSVQQMLASGQIAPDDADSLMANMRSSLEARSKGYTPEQYQQRIQAQGEFGRGTLEAMDTQGDTMAGQFLSAANKVRDPSVFANISPYQNAAGMLGGQPMIQQALDLIGQVKPITSRAGALDAASKYSQASKLLGAHIAQTQPGAPDSGTNVDLAKMGFSGYGTPQGYLGADNPNVFGSGTGNVPTPPDFGMQSINDPSRGPGPSQADQLLAAAAPNELRIFGR